MKVADTQYMRIQDNTNKSVSVLSNYFILLSSALNKLGKSIEVKTIEKLSIEIVRAMGSELRDYHKPEHSLDVSLEQSPIGTIAAIFHDIVYVQVDPTWRTNFKSHIENFLPDENFKLNTKAGFLSEKKDIRKSILVLFGMENTEEVLPGKGLNELLSALVMEHMLSQYLTKKEILSIAACIESTIPFRKVDADGKTPSDRLSVRLHRAGVLIDSDFNEPEKANIVTWCRGIVAKDLSSFAAVRLNTFISNTWNVMNENNPALRNAYFYISDYRKAVYGVIPFLNSLDPDQMFWDAASKEQTLGRPLAEHAKRNLKLGCEYLKAVGVSLSLIEAIAIETGGDMPFEALVGSTRKSREHSPLSIGAFLPSKDFRVFSSDEKDVFLLLKNGREFRARFDRKESPLGAYLYQNLTYDQFNVIYQQAMQFHLGKLGSINFINSFSESVIADVLTALARTCPLRSLQLIELLTKLEADKVA